MGLITTNEGALYSVNQISDVSAAIQGNRNIPVGLLANTSLFEQSMVKTFLELVKMHAGKVIDLMQTPTNSNITHICVAIPGDYKDQGFLDKESYMVTQTDGIDIYAVPVSISNQRLIIGRVGFDIKKKGKERNIVGPNIYLPDGSVVRFSNNDGDRVNQFMVADGLLDSLQQAIALGAVIREGELTLSVEP